MARMLYRRGEPSEGQKVFLAVAAYEGLSAGFTYALYHTGIALQKAGIDSELAIYSGNCHVDDSRNRLVRDFLLSDCTDLVFLDSDLGWYASDFVKLLGYDRDIVAGIYPKKNGDDHFPVIFPDGEIWSDRDGLIEAIALPTGFLRIKRQVLERMAAVSLHYNAKHEADSAIACIFERTIIDGTRWGGDYNFCRKWRDMGGKMYIDPMMRFEHSGEHTWTGCVGAWMRQKNGIGLVDGLKAFRQGTEEVQTTFDLFDAWGNPFAASPILLLALGWLAREAKGPILELGGGLSSLVMAAATDQTVHVIEDNPIFAEQVRAEAKRHGLANIEIHCAPHKDGWYDQDSIPLLDWALVFIDGPRMTTGGRAEALTRLRLNRAVVVADDVQDDGGLPQIKLDLEVTHWVREISAGRRHFAVGAPRMQLLSIAAE